VIKLRAKTKDKEQLLIFGFEEGNFRILLEEDDRPILVRGSTLRVPGLDFVFIAGETFKQVEERIQPIFDTLRGTDGEPDDVPTLMIKDYYTMTPIYRNENHLVLVFGFSAVGIEALKKGALAELKFDNPISGQTVRILPFYVASKDKFEQQMLAAGLVGPETGWSKDPQCTVSQETYSEMIKIWKENISRFEGS
jgi:hypothetical protein